MPHNNFANVDWNSKKEVMDTLKQEGALLEKASINLQDDAEVVRTAIHSDLYAYKFSSKRLQNDKEFVLPLLRKYPELFNLLPQEVQMDQKFILEELLPKVPEVYAHLNTELRNNQEFILSALEATEKKSNSIYDSVPKEFLNCTPFLGDAISKQNEDFNQAGFKNEPYLFISCIKALAIEKDSKYKSDSPYAYSALRPLQDLRETISNQNKKKALQDLIIDFTKIIDEHYRNDGSPAELFQSLQSAINKANPILEQQEGLKGIIDRVAKAIINFFKKPKDSTNTFTFFSSAHPAKDEMQKASKDIQEKFGNNR